MKNSLIIAGIIVILFGLLWHFIPLFQVGTIFELNDICELKKEMNIPSSPAAGTATPQWMSDGACMWLPFAVLVSFASTSGGIVLIIGGFIVRKKKQKV